jgi:hypothetical protein
MLSVLVMRPRVLLATLVLAACGTSGNGSSPPDAGLADGAGSITPEAGGNDATYGTPQDCMAAGGRCIVGPAVGCIAEGPPNTCNCNPGCAPSGAICCVAFADAGPADAARADAAGCSTGDPLGSAVGCTEPVDGGSGGWPSTWAAALAAACPPSASTIVKSCTGGLNVVQMSGIDTQAFGYYSAATGNFVASISFGAGGVPPFCEGPDPPPCVSCVEDDGLCAGMTDGGSPDSGNETGTPDAGSTGD